MDYIDNDEKLGLGMVLAVVLTMIVVAWLSHPAKAHGQVTTCQWPNHCAVEKIVCCCTPPRVCLK